MPDYSTPRVQAHRAHYKGDHSQCNPRTCRTAKDLWADNTNWQITKAIYDELIEHDRDLHLFFNDPEIIKEELAAREPVPSGLHKVWARRMLREKLGDYL